ncbi:unnamed protein product [Adineta steineri]|uniref:Uncharacterized protein n=1 Tax=Adineta steineri TaxID=433720 RepID=A0A813V8B6_9BILA|nr:unnamed protein product [Adineta steineri]CAF1070187.1 unnamed protein product [Adineta steineri]
MATSNKNQIYGQIIINNNEPNFNGDEILYISIRDSLRHEIDCIELGSKVIHLSKGQSMPIKFQCLYDPTKACMKFEEIKTIPGGITLAATIERNETILYINNTNISLGENINIPLVKND